MEDLFDGEYEILETLGEGASANVFKVRHKQLGYIRAIKVLNTIIRDEKDKKYTQFLEECKMLLRLGNGSQDNIVQIARPRLLKGHALVEMEYIVGGDLNGYIENVCKGFMPMREVYRLLEEIGGQGAHRGNT